MTLEHTFTNATLGMSSRVYRLEDERRLVIIRDDDAQQDLDVSKTFAVGEAEITVQLYARRCVGLH